MGISKYTGKCSPLFAAVGCVCIHQNEVLLLRRNRDKSHPLSWGVPTGKIEFDESDIGTIVRELYEETSLVTSGERLRYVDTFFITTEDVSFTYALYYIEFREIPLVVINKKEHNEFRWVHYETLDAYELVPYAKETILLAIGKQKSSRHVQLSLFTGEPEKDETLTIDFQVPVVHSMDPSHSHRRKWIIAFGSPAAGKTTTLKELHKRYPHSSLVSDNRNILIRGRRLNRYLHEATEHKRVLFYFYFQMEVLPEKFARTLTAEDYSFIDESIYSTLAYSTSLYLLRWITDDEYKTFLTNYKIYAALLPTPGKILYFKCPPDLLMKRIRRRARMIEQFYTKEYLELLNIGFEEVSQELQSSGFDVVTVNTENTSTSKIVNQLCEGIFE